MSNQPLNHANFDEEKGRHAGRDAEITPGSGIPPAIPPVRNLEGASPQVRGESGDSPLPKYTGFPLSRISSSAPPASAPAKPRSSSPSPVGKRKFAAIERRLSERDHEVLQQIAVHQYLTNHHLTALVFRGHTSQDSAERITRRVVNRLHRDGLIEALPQRVGGTSGGANARIWRLRPTGGRVIGDMTNGRFRPPARSLRFVQHCLAIADVNATAQQLADAGEVESASVRLEPDCWRSYLGSAGERQKLRPDCEVTIGGHDTDGAFEDRWFVEVDMGHESLPTLHKKCVQYQTYRASGVEQAGSDGVFPLVLWVMHGIHAERRVDQLRQHISRSPKLTTKLFRVVTSDDVAEALRGGATS